MKQYSNLKYAQRAGSDITLRCTVQTVRSIQKKGSVETRILDVTDGVIVAKLVLFGGVARMRFQEGNTIVVGPVYYSDQYQNFALQRGGTAFIQ